MKWIDEFGNNYEALFYFHILFLQAAYSYQTQWTSDMELIIFYLKK